jgi:hypothetical protein
MKAKLIWSPVLAASMSAAPIVNPCLALFVNGKESQTLVLWGRLSPGKDVGCTATAPISSKGRKRKTFFAVERRKNCLLPCRSLRRPQPDHHGAAPAAALHQTAAALHQDNTQPPPSPASTHPPPCRSPPPASTRPPRAALVAVLHQTTIALHQTTVAPSPLRSLRSL